MTLGYYYWYLTVLFGLLHNTYVHDGKRSVKTAMPMLVSMLLTLYISIYWFRT